MIFRYSILFCVLCTLTFSAQTYDSLVTFRDLEFKNSSEQECFVNFSPADKNSYLTLFMTSHDGLRSFNLKDVQTRVSNCVNTLQKETEGKTEVKKVKHIYRYVHDHFFRTYKLRNSFSDIFTKGEYNCVSASALYAIIFNLMDIPFQVMEAPRHVFLIAYPETHRILIESTSPEDGYNTYSESYVEKYVRSLYASKVISQQEFDTKSVRQLFEKYYYSSTSISLKNLAGIQYSNYGLYSVDDQDYENAAKEFKKACYLNADERGRYLLRTSLLTLVNNNGYKELKTVKQLSLLCRYNQYGDADISDEYIKNEFLRVKDQQLITDTDHEKFDKSFGMLNEAIKDSTLKRELAFLYHYELARLGYMNLKPDNYVLEHFREAYILKPDHANLQTLIIAHFGQRIEKNKQMDQVQKQIGEYGGTFGFLNENKHFLAVKANCCLELAYQNFVLKNSTKGEEYFKAFEDLCSEGNKNEVEANTYYVEKAYSEAAGFYFKKGNKVKAKQVLQKGLNYAPNSFALRLRLSQL